MLELILLIVAFIYIMLTWKKDLSSGTIVKKVLVSTINSSLLIMALIWLI